MSAEPGGSGLLDNMVIPRPATYRDSIGADDGGAYLPCEPSLTVVRQKERGRNRSGCSPCIVSQRPYERTSYFFFLR